jgi:hypothetical protein
MAYDTSMRVQARPGHRRGTGRTLPVLAFALLSAAGSAAGAAGAFDKREPAPVFDSTAAPAQGVREGVRMAAGSKSADRIVQDIERKYKAKVVKDPETREVNGRKVLVLRLYDDKKGRVWEVRVDAETGKEL